MAGDSHVAIFGSVQIQRARCPECDEMSLVLKNDQSACCDAPVGVRPDGYKRESQPVQRKKNPKAGEMKKILEDQEDRCFYCERGFDTWHWFRGEMIQMKVHWDHQLPWILTQDNNASNFVAACHVCNLAKGAMVFGTVDEVKVFLQNWWEEKEARWKLPGR